MSSLRDRSRTSDEASRVAQTYLAQRALGHSQSSRPGLRVVRDARTPLVYDANFVHDVDAELATDGPRLMQAIDDALEGLGHRKVLCDPRTPPAIEAWLAALDFGASTTVQMVLDGSLRSGPTRRVTGLEIEPVVRDEQWAVLEALQHANFGEQCRRRGVPPYDRAVAREMIASWRVKTGMTFWLARVEGEPSAYVGAWPGLDGDGGERLGMVESLFTLPKQRHRGIATTLIARGVDDVRERGAGPVLIGAEIDDTPKRMYRALGFRPVCLTREWQRAATA